MKLVEVTKEDGVEQSTEPEDIIKTFFKSGMEQAKFEEKEIGKTDKEINNFLSRMRVYIRYHKMDTMIAVSRKAPWIFLTKPEVKS